MEKWCEIFKAGTHTDHYGRKITKTIADIDELIKNFNEKNPDVPIVIGHPKVNSPAFGWVEKLKRKGDTLLASFKKVAPEFAEWVDKGLYQTRSISLYGDNTLRHVGWLGAQPPAIKGLAEYQFAENEDITIFNFSEAVDCELKTENGNGQFSFADPLNASNQAQINFKFTTLAQILSSLREFLIDKYDIETADNVIRSWRLEDLRHIDTQDKEAVASYCEAIFNPPYKENILKIDNPKEQKKPENPEIIQNFSEVEKAFQEKDDEIEQLRQELEAERAEKRKADYTQFAEQLVDSGNITPAQKSTVIDLMEVCGQSGTYDFAEGDEKSVLNRFKDLLNNCKQIEFAEIARKDCTDLKDKTIDFSDPEKAANLIAVTAREKGISEIEAKELLKGGS